MAKYAAAVDVGTGYKDLDAYPRIKTLNHAGTSPDVDLTAVSAATATLVADGASPTQGHVTTLNNALAPVVAAANHDLMIVWSTTNISTWQQFETAVRAALQVARGSGKLTNS